MNHSNFKTLHIFRPPCRSVHNIAGNPGVEKFRSPFGVSLSVAIGTIAFFGLFILLKTAAIDFHRSLDIRIDEKHCVQPPDEPYFLLPLKNRNELPMFLESLGSRFQIGAEIGVQSGDFSLHILKNWRYCKKFYLIDVWAKLDNYNDLADVSDEANLRKMNATKKKLSAFANKTEFIRGRSDVVHDRFADDSLDFIYIDARHDYCAVKKDVHVWWQKVRCGGIMAGHDYVSHEYVAPQQDWTVCEDGHRELGAVKRAVNEFAMQNELLLSTTQEPAGSWILRKPFRTKVNVR